MIDLRRVTHFMALFFFVLLCGAQAEDSKDGLRLAYIFGDGAVLQRQKPVPVWGWAAAGSNVDVKFSGQSKSARADSDGYWKVELEPMEANAKGQELSVSADNEKVELEDVVVGEVWIAAGQSNMNHGGPDIDTGVYPFYKSPDNEEDLPRVRHRRFGWGASLEPQPDVQEMFREPESRWGVKEDYPEGSSTSMAQYFARIVRDELEVPVGIIHVAVSGINQVAWLSKETLETFSGKGGNYYEEFLAEREAALAKGGEIRSWDDFLKVETDWSADKKGNWPGRGMTYVSFPTALYNTRIVPLAPYAIRGVIWHQGEAGPGGPHAERMVAKVQQWRELFGQDFAFIWGTLSKLGSDEPPLLPAKSGFYRSSTNAQLRKALELFGDDPLTEYVELYDLGNQDTHFSLKAEGGRRMGLAAMAKIYGKPGIYTGPRLVESSFRGDTATLKFSQVGDGLNYEPTINGISGFYVFDGKTPAWGEVKLIDKTTVEVSYPGGGSLEYVGYGTANNPHETLFNTDQIPASPFAAKDGDVKTVNAEQTYSLLEPQEKMGGAKFHVAHVRKDGYIFEIRPGRGKALETVSMLAYVSPEWSGVAVEAEGESLQVEEITEDGQKFVKFDAPTGSQRIIVADPGKIESFRGVDRF